MGVSDFRLPLRCEWDLRSFGILSSVEWQFLTDVLGQPLESILKGQVLQDGTDRLPRNYHSTLRKIPKERTSETWVTKHCNPVFGKKNPCVIMHIIMQKFLTFYFWPQQLHISNKRFCILLDIANSFL